jgi:cysteinyl-tRNA synthetase
MHNGLMKIGAGKMSKSQGNEVVVAELLKRHPPETLRFFLLSTHYRRPIDFSEERLEEVQRGLESFYRFFERLTRITKANFYELQAPRSRGQLEPPKNASDFWSEVSAHRDTFLEHMDDDFNTGGAIGVLFELLNSLNRYADIRRLEEAGAMPDAVEAVRRGAVVLKELSQILGIFLEPRAEPTSSSDGLVNGLMQLLMDLRADARKNKNFAVADQIRQRLAQLGVTLEDRPGGTGWRAG